MEGAWDYKIPKTDGIDGDPDENAAPKSGDQGNVGETGAKSVKELFWRPWFKGETGADREKGDSVSCDVNY